MGDRPEDDDFDLDAAAADDASEQRERAERIEQVERAAGVPPKVQFRIKGGDSPTFELDPDEDVPEFGLDSGEIDAFGIHTGSAGAPRVRDSDPWSAFTGTEKIPTQFDRINEAQIVLGLLQGFLTSSTVLERIRNEVSSVAERIAHVQGLESESESESSDIEKIRAEIDETLDELEDRILETERKVPASLLRRQFDSQDFDEATLAHYLRFQLEHLDATPECWGRIDLIVTRLSRRKRGENQYLPREPAQLVALWNDVLPPSQTGADVRKAAVKFFDNATARLDEFDDIEEIFTSGYYVDVAGYKISLRLSYFDPAVLYAAAKTNIALHNWLAEHQRAGRNLAALGNHFASAHEQIRLIFTRQGQDFEALARFRARLLGKDEPEPEPKVDPHKVWTDPYKSGKSTARRLAIGAGLVLALVLAVPTVLSVWKTSKRDLKDLSLQDARTIHPMLIKASIGGNPQTLLVGEIDSAQWVLLNRQQKEAELEVLRTGLRSRGLSSALIYRESVIAIHIVDGKVRVLE